MPGRGPCQGRNLEPRDALAAAMVPRSAPVARSALVAAFVVAVLLAGCAERPPAAATISLKDERFQGGDKQVQEGATIAFLNEDEVPHTVTVHRVGDPTDSAMKDSVVTAGSQTRLQVITAGTYKVWCRYHGNMDSGMHMTITGK